MDMGPADFPDGPVPAGPRWELEPLRVAHAEEMAIVLADPALYTFTGGAPLGTDDLRELYRRQVRGWSADGSERWLNWVLRRRQDGRAVGYLQATITARPGGVTAEVAWVIGTEHQGRGYATEAARVLVDWLRAQGAAPIVAHVMPGHRASERVASAVGLTRTTTVLDGEIRWEG